MLAVVNRRDTLKRRCWEQYIDRDLGAQVVNSLGAGRFENDDFLTSMHVLARLPLKFSLRIHHRVTIQLARDENRHVYVILHYKTAFKGTCIDTKNKRPPCLDFAVLL